MTIFWVVALAGLGLIFGSFCNALVWRLRGQELLHEKIEKLRAKKKPTKTDTAELAEAKQELQTLSMSKGRSMCSKCRHSLAAKDLVPLFSWLWLAGKCRYCRKPIEDTPLLEAGLPIMFLVSYFAWPLGLQGYGLLAFVAWLATSVGFAALTAYDLRWYLLPDKIVWPLAVLALAQVVAHAVVFDGGWSVLLTALWGVLTCSGIFYVLHMVSDGTWIGGGDVKLGIVLGLWVGGPLQGLLVIFAASLFGTIASVPMLLQKKLGKGSVIPFGPFLMLAAVVVMLTGQRLIDWLDRLMITV